MLIPGARCAPLWITVYDKDHPDKFYRWCRCQLARETATGRQDGVEAQPLPHALAFLARCCLWCSVTVKRPLAGTPWGAVTAGTCERVLIIGRPA